MKKIVHYCFLLFILFSSCKEQRNQQQNQPSPPAENPTAFEDKTSSGELYSKRGYHSDMVDALYKELLEKDKALKDLEEAIDNLDGQKSDSLDLFTTFDEKNLSYYSSAQNHVAAIKDSVLRLKMKAMIDNSLAAYNTKITTHKSLIDLLNSKHAEISNLHIVLKIVKTLPLAEKYQAENIPSTKPVEKLIGVYNKLIQQADTLSKAN